MTIEHRRMPLCDPDRLLERQGHNARAEANSRRACRDMSETHERGRAACVAIKVMLSNPGQVEAVPLRVNDLLGREAIPLARMSPDRGAE